MESRYAHNCPICTRSVSGNKELGFLCGGCNLLFPLNVVRPRRDRRQQIQSFEQYVRSENGDVYHIFSCKYAKRIEERVILESDEVSGLRACNCIKVND